MDTTAPETLQPELELDHIPALEQQMRTLFDTRWRRWHRAGSFEAAMQDPVTARLLMLTVKHMPSQAQKTHKRRR